MALQLIRGLADDLKMGIEMQNQQRGNVNSVTTLSGFLFAIQGQEKKSLHQSVLGRAAGAIVRGVVFRLFWSARRGSLFKVDEESVTDLRKVLPNWLVLHTSSAVAKGLRGLGQSNKIDDRETGTINVSWMQKHLDTEQIKSVHFEESKLLRKHVSECISELESYRTATLEGSKRYKRSISDDVASDAVHALFRKAVSTTRTAVLKQLNDGRNRGRDCVFRYFGFILEIILGVNGVSKNGFGIEIPDMTDEEAQAHETFSSISEAVVESAVVMAKASKSEAQRVDDANDETLKSLTAKFPFLSCTLKYKLQFNPDDKGDSSQRNSATGSSQERNNSAPSRSENTATVSTIEWDVTEVLSLHKVALDFLFEAISADSGKYVLRVCKESLKAVHAIALAFRGLILQVLKLPVNAIEANMINGVYLNEDFWIKVRASIRRSSIAQGNSSESGSEARTAGGGIRNSEFEGGIEETAGTRALMSLSDKKKLLTKVNTRLKASKREYEDHMISVRRSREKRRYSMSVITSSGKEHEALLDIDGDLDPV